ncbi:MAG: alpha/beta hydrolase [Halioglobus sp.]|nr:alpha/beta hydrolase [Halioglobus sp.]
MFHAIQAWLARLLQPVKVWLFRAFYRFSNARVGRTHASGGPTTNLQIPVPGTSIKARLYSNALGANKPLIVFFHGGGWVIGDLETHDPFCQALCAATGCSVIAVDYRLAPEHTFPAALDDCLAAIGWAADHVTELGANNSRLLLAGDSAGGNLATCACLEVDPACREKIVGQVLIYPATDHYSAGFASYVEKATGQTLTTAIIRWFWDSYLGDLPAQAPAAQRAFPMRSTKTASLPPTLLVTAENDPLRDEGKAYAIKLQEQGVAVSYHHFANAEHGFACSEGPHADFHGFIQQLNAWLAGLEYHIEESQT